jgi:hypothetical protein
MSYRDEKIVVDVRDLEHGEILYTDTGGKQRTYYPAYSIWLEVQMLQILTVLNEPAEEGGAPSLKTRVRGAASLKDDSISVLGDPPSEVRALTINFETGNLRPQHPLESNAFFSESAERLGRAVLGFNRADWEIGTSDEWWISCYLPEPFIDALVADIRSGHIDSMKVALMLGPLYTTKHPLAPLSSRGGLFLRPNKRDNTIEHPEMASGMVWSVHFASAPRDLRTLEAPEPVERAHVDEEPQASPPDSVASGLAILASRVELLRSTLKWLGGLIVVALLILALK